MAGKLGQQISSQQQQGSPQRLSRTQRKIQYEQKVRDERASQLRFQELQNEASRLQAEVFANKTNVQDYTEEYNKLSPDLKQFFITPQELSAQIEQKKQVERQTFKARMDQTNVEIQRILAQKQAKIDWFNALEGSRKADNQLSFEKSMTNYNFNIEEFTKTIDYMTLEDQKIEQGAIANDIYQYARSRASYEVESQRSKEASREQFNMQVKTGVIDEDLIKLGLNKQNVTYDKFVGAVKNYKPQTITTITKNKYEGIDTSLTLGGKTEQTKTSSVMVEGTTKLSNEAMRLNEYYKKPTFLDTVFNKIKGVFTNIGGGEDTVKLETQTTYSSPIGTGGKGTAIITKTPTEKTSVYINELITYNQKADRLSSDIFKDYESKINALSNISQGGVNAIKTEEQNKFNDQIKFYNEDFSKNYETKIREIDQKNSIKDYGTFGLGGVAKYYYGLSEKDRKERESVTAIMDFNKNVYKVNKEGDAKNLFPNYQENTIKTYSKMREKGTPEWLAREITGAGDFGKGTIQGVYTAIKENPRTFAFKTTAWTGAIAGSYVLSSYTGGLGGVATSPVLKWAGTGLMGLYGGSVVARTVAPSTSYEIGKTLGKISGEEILPMGIGGLTGSYLGMKSVGAIDYVNYKYIKKYPYRSPYKLTDINILRGNEKFPTISPHGKSAQIKEFKSLDKNYLTPDERKLLKQGKKLKNIGSHATASRSAFKEDTTKILAEGREINAMSVSAKKLSANFLDINKNPSYSLYSGQAIPTGSVPLGMRIETQGLKKIPKNYKPKLKINELEEILGTKINKKYFKQTAYIYEKGNYGTTYIEGLKPEVEGYQKGFGDLKRTMKQKYYTQINDPKFYQKMIDFERKGYSEHALRVNKFSLKDPSTWIDRIVPRLDKKLNLTFGRKAGQFKPMKKGRVVPYERFEALQSGEDLSKKIKNLLSSKPRSEVVDILKENQKTSKAVSSSYGSDFKISASYPSSYAVQSLLSSGLKSSKYPTSSFSKSYNSSIKSSSPSSLKSSIYSKSSSSKKSSSRISSASSSSSSRMKSLIYSMSSGGSSSISYDGSTTFKIPKLPNIAKIKQVIAKKRQRKTHEIYGLMPDFTSRAYGIAPKNLTVKQALKEMKRIQTGFEVRSGARIKGYRNIQEKDLLSGIMQ